MITLNRHYLFTCINFIITESEEKKLKKGNNSFLLSLSQLSPLCNNYNYFKLNIFLSHSNAFYTITFILPVKSYLVEEERRQDKTPSNNNNSFYLSNFLMRIVTVTVLSLIIIRCNLLKKNLPGKKCLFVLSLYSPVILSCYL